MGSAFLTSKCSFVNNITHCLFRPCAKERFGNGYQRECGESQEEMYTVTSTQHHCGMSGQYLHLNKLLKVAMLLY